MTDYEPKVGDRVRVTFTHEGVVIRVGDAGGLTVEGSPWGFRRDDPRTRVEPVEEDA